MALERRRVDGALIWPEAAAAKRPSPLKSKLELDQALLIQRLEELDSAPVVWIGALFEVNDAETVSKTCEALSVFESRVKICYEC
jgi:hypothetical protein